MWQTNLLIRSNNTQCQIIAYIILVTPQLNPRQKASNECVWQRRAEGRDVSPAVPRCQAHPSTGKNWADIDSDGGPACCRDAIQTKLHKWLSQNFFLTWVIDNLNNWLLFAVLLTTGPLHQWDNRLVIQFFPDGNWYWGSNQHTKSSFQIVYRIIWII